MPFEPGQIASDYEILGLLGKGGMGRVYRVRNVISNRIEAMKVLLADVAAEAELGDRFIGEIRTLARLDHPNIAKFLTAFKCENQLVMVMEFVEGFTLSDRGKEGPIPLDEVISCIGQTLAALGYAHQNGVIHRDIKPSNIMVTPHGVVKLMDFGIAKSTFEPLLTRPGTTMGSMLYMSPEQVRGTTVDARSDLYSVGVVLYELTAGRRPFEAENTYSILQAQLNENPKPPVELNPKLPAALNDIILTAMAKEPMHRFQSAEAFRNALESVRGRPVPTAQAGAAQINPAQMPVQAMTPQPAGKRGLWMALGAVACVCVLAGGVVLAPRLWRISASSATPHSNATQVVQNPSQQQQPAAVAPASQPASGQTATSAPDVVPPAREAHKASSSPLPKREVVKTTQTQPFDSPAVKQELPPPQPVQQQTPQPQASVPSGPSQQELDAANDDLTKLHARADAVFGSLEHLRQEQAAQGLNLRQDISASASRLTGYLQAADRALQGNSLEAARKNMERAEQELNKLESFFGR